MAKLKIFFFLILLVLILLVGVAFFIRNETLVVVDFYLIRVSNLSVAAWVVLSFCFGGVIGMLVSLPSTITQKMKYKHQSVQLKRRDTEIKRLQGEPVKGS